MKTAKEKAMEYTDKEFAILPKSMAKEKMRHRAQKDFEAGYNEAMRCQSSPKIKQLEWEKCDGKYWEAITPIGTYSITFDFGVYVTLCDMDNVVDRGWMSLEKAKIACNNDFERRVMECLEL